MTAVADTTHKAMLTVAAHAKNAERQRVQQRRRIGDPEAADRAGHGNASTYQNYGCRCRPCTEANTAKSLAYKARRRERAALAETGGGV